jgi:hypothetical protein
MEPLVFESCHSTWLFDTERMRFRRILKGLESGPRHVATDWRAYFGLEVDPQGEYFSVLLAKDGSRLLRSWRHTADCTECGEQVTSELSLNDLRSALTENPSEQQTAAV